VNPLKFHVHIHECVHCIRSYFKFSHFNMCETNVPMITDDGMCDVLISTGHVN
jgi:hypothetical protein